MPETPEVSIEEQGDFPLTNEQAEEIVKLGKEKLIISKQNIPKHQYNTLVRALLGNERFDELTLKNAEISGLTRNEAEIVIESIDSLVLKPGMKPPTIQTADIKEYLAVSKELQELIPHFKEVGVVERVRPTRQVFQKIGLRRQVWEPAFEAEGLLYQELMAFRKQLNQIKGLVKKNRRSAVFDEIENPGTIVDLTLNEKKAVAWFRKFFEAWADRLELSPEQRRSNYITHIFEAAISEEIKTKHKLDPDLLVAMEWITPKTVFNPFLQKRLGKKAGLKRDPFLAAEAYEARELKVYYYEPLIRKIRIYEKYLPEHARKYLRGFII